MAFKMHKLNSAGSVEAETGLDIISFFVDVFNKTM